MTRKTRLTKPLLSLMLAVLMMASVLVAGIGFDTKVSAESTEYISDGGFESDPWSSGYWSVSDVSENDVSESDVSESDVSASDTADISLMWFSYASNSYISGAEGDYCFSYYYPTEVTAEAPVTVTQNVSLPAGTYTFTILSMGGDGAKVAPIIDGAIGTYTEADGWNQWQTLTYTITLDSAVSDYTVGFAAIGTSEAWGYVDGVSICEATLPVTYGGVSIVPVDDLNEDFLLGVDVSSIISLENAGVEFYDFTGTYEQDIFKTLAQAGVNTIRVRVWVDPYNSSTGVGYGGGNNDIETAVKIGKRASRYGMGLLVDFHFSDFWSDPSSQSAPKAWSSYSVSEKSTAIYDYCYSSLQSLIDAGVDVTMVQIGNETTSGFCGETSWSNMCTLMQSGASAVRAIDPSILIAVHFTNPEKGRYPTYANYLKTYGVDYDVFATSYYPYWHGTVTNLTSVLDNIADTYGKKVMVAETAWPYTYTNGDGHNNTVSSGITETYAISAQGQADAYRAVVNAVNDASNGCGVFWWEPAWIPVNNLTTLSGSAYTAAYNANKTAWEKYGCGWASSAAAEYSSDAGSYYGGSSWDNQAMFNFNGTPMDSLMVFNLIQGKNTVSTVTDKSTIGTTIPTMTAKSAGYDRATVSWDAVDTAVSYEIWYSLSASSGFAKAATVSDVTTYTHTGRVCNKTYYYKVRAVDEYGEYSQYSEVASVKIVPAAPATVKAARASYNSIKVSWSKVSGASGYVIYRANSENGTYSAIKTITKGTTTSFTNTGLTCGKTYYYKVKAYRTISGKKIYGTASVAFSAKPYLSKTSSISVTRSSYGLLIKWKKVTGATGYKIYRATDPDGEYTLIKTITKGSTVKYTNTSVVPGVTYYYKVTATRSGSEGVVSAVKSLSPTLAKPTSPKAARYAYNKIKLTWKKVSGASGYVIFRSDSASGTYTEVGRVSGNTTVSYIDTDLATGKTYYYKIAAYRTAGGLTGIGTKTSYVYAKTTMGYPGSFAAARSSYDSIKLTWKAPGGADGYYVYRATSKNGTYSQLAKIEDGTVLTYTDDNLITGKYYYYKVRAYHIEDGTEVLSAYTAYKYARGTLSTPKITAKKTAAGTATITVTPVDGADGYVVYRATSKNGTYTNVTSKCTQTTDENGNLVFTYAGQTKNKTYYYKVRAYHTESSGNVYSAYSSYKSLKV